MTAQVGSTGPAMTILAATHVRCAADAPLVAQLENPPANLSEQLARFDRLCGLAIVVSQRLHAALPPLTVPPDRVAVLCGSRHGCLTTDAAFYRGALQGAASPRLFAYTLHSSPVGAVSIQHGYCGPGYTLVGSAIGGLQALAEAQHLFASQQADACLILSCDVAEDRAGQDHAAALLIVPAGSVGSIPPRGLVHAAVDTYRPSQPETALATCVARLRRTVAGEAGLSVLTPAEPPLCRLAALCSDRGDVKSPSHGASREIGTPFVLAASDPQGQAAAALLTLYP